MKAIRVWYAVDRDGYFYTKAPYRDVDSETAMEKHIPLQVNCSMV